MTDFGLIRNLFMLTGLWVETWKEGQDFVSYCPTDKSSLPKGTHFKYETRTINKIYINEDLHWTNPRSTNSGVRSVDGDISEFYSAAPVMALPT